MQQKGPADNIAAMGCGTFVLFVLLLSWLFSYVLSDDTAIIAGVIGAIVAGAAASFYVGWRDTMRQRGLSPRGQPLDDEQAP